MDLFVVPTIGFICSTAWSTSGWRAPPLERSPLIATAGLCSSSDETRKQRVVHDSRARAPQPRDSLGEDRDERRFEQFEQMAAQDLAAADGQALAAQAFASRCARYGPEHSCHGYGPLTQLEPFQVVSCAAF
jgi:hypothetical protein